MNRRLAPEAGVRSRTTSWSGVAEVLAEEAETGAKPEPAVPVQSVNCHSMAEPGARVIGWLMVSEPGPADPGAIVPPVIDGWKLFQKCWL